MPDSRNYQFIQTLFALNRNLKKLYNTLLGIPTSYVEAEICFSTKYNFSTK